MIRVLIVLIISFCGIKNIYAHDADKAFFKIEERIRTIEITVEFPWSVRNALIEAYPYLESSDSKADFKEALFDYISKSLQLWDAKDKLLPLREIAIQQTEGHSHQANYLLIFEGTHLAKIRNVILFNIYNTQENYHMVSTKTQKINFVTTQQNPEYFFEKNREAFWNTAWWSIVFIVLGISGVILWWFGRRRIASVSKK